MKVIGLTGNLGCGKSTVAGMLREVGVPTIDADALSREVRDSDAGVRAAILAHFGTLDPAALAARAFDDSTALHALEAIVHPAVREVALARLAALQAGGVATAAIEAIKLLGSPLRDRCDAVWVVTCTEADRSDRLAARGLSPADAAARLGQQPSQDEFVREADVVIDGSAPPERTRAQVLAALEELVAG